MSENHSAAAAQENWKDEPLLAWREWAPGLVTFATARPPQFDFTPGQFARLTLGNDENQVSRAFSVASSPQEPLLEFLAVLVPEGAFSTRLAHLRAGDSIRVNVSSYGVFTADNFVDGRDLWLIASGTGLAPFISMLREGAVLARFEHVVLVHSVRHARDLAYRNEIGALAKKVTTDKLRYVPVTTRESLVGVLHGRVTEHIMNGHLETAARLMLDEHRSRLMICGNPQMCSDLRRLLPERGLNVNRTRRPGQLIFENYW